MTTVVRSYHPIAIQETATNMNNHVRQNTVQSLGKSQSRDHDQDRV
jgi:hypothetical protein